MFLVRFPCWISSHSHSHHISLSSVVLQAARALAAQWEEENTSTVITNTKHHLFATFASSFYLFLISIHVLTFPLPTPFRFFFTFNTCVMGYVSFTSVYVFRYSASSVMTNCVFCFSAWTDRNSSAHSLHADTGQQLFCKLLLSVSFATLSGMLVCLHPCGERGYISCYSLKLLFGFHVCASQLWVVLGSHAV